MNRTLMGDIVLVEAGAPPYDQAIQARQSAANTAGLCGALPLASQTDAVIVTGGILLDLFRPLLPEAERRTCRTLTQFQLSSWLNRSCARRSARERSTVRRIFPFCTWRAPGMWPKAISVTDSAAPHVLPDEGEPHSCSGEPCCRVRTVNSV